MNNQDYGKAKAECWEEFNNNVAMCEDRPKICFFRAFDYAYALGKQTEAITQEDIEMAAEKYTERAYYPVGQSDCSEDFHMEAEECLAEAFKAGANFALGKQEKDADTVIIDKEEYDELCRCQRYMDKYILDVSKCPTCGEYVRSGYFCSNCD